MRLRVTGRGDRSAKALAAATLATAMLLTGFLHSIADKSAASILDARWRGAYDILVTSAASDSTGSTSGSGPMAPYAIATAAERLTIGDVQRIRSIPGVELAAPIGDVLVRSEFDGPQLMFQVPFDAEDEHVDPIALRISTKLTVDDRGSPQTLRTTSYDVVLDTHGGSSEVILRDGEVASGDDCEPRDGQEPCVTMQRVPVSYARSGDSDVVQSSGILAEDKLLFELPVLTETFPHILFVDPAAEAELLGAAGDFLEPLRDIGSDFRINDLRRMNEDALSPQVSDWLASIGPAEASWEVPGSTNSAQVIPLVTALSSNISAELEVAVESSFDGRPTPSRSNDSDLLRWELPRRLQEGEPGQERVVESFAVGSLLEAADPQTMVLPLPGLDTGKRLASPPPRASRIDAWAFTSQHLPTVVDERSTLDIDEFVNPVSEETAGIRSDTWLSFEPTAGRGSEAVAHELVQKSTISDAHQPLVIAVGTFDWEEPLEAAAQTVPLASIDRSETRLVIDGEGTAVSELIAPSLTGLGISSSRPTAMASIYTAGSLGIESPVSSVRVRVAGVQGGYTSTNIAMVQEVVDSLRSAGYRAQMVAGSSRTAVRFDVTGYPLTKDDGTVETGSLGTVEQSWPELGAVSRVERSVSVGNEAVAAVTVINAAVLFSVTFWMHRGRRRQTARLLAAVGWGSRSIRRAFFRDDTLPIVIVCAGTVASLGSSFSLGGGQPTAGMGLTTAGSLLALAVAFGTSMRIGGTSSSGEKPSAVRRGGTDGLPRPIGYGALLAVRDARTSLLLSLTCATFSSAFGSLVVVAQSTAAQMGHSDLALLVHDANSICHIALAAVSLMAAILLVRSIVTLARPQLKARVRLLSALGWDSRDIRAVRIVEVACAALPGVGVGVAVTTVLALSATQGILPSASSAAIGGLAAGAAFLVNGITS